MTPLEMLKNPELVQNMTAGQKLIAGLQVTILGIVIVFLILVLLQYVLKLMERLVDVRKEDRVDTIGKIAQERPAPVAEGPASAAEEREVDGKLIAAITAALTAGYFQRTSRFTVKRIRRIVDDVPIWGKVARGGGNQAEYFQINEEGYHE